MKILPCACGHAEGYHVKRKGEQFHASCTVLGCGCENFMPAEPTQKKNFEYRNTFDDFPAADFPLPWNPEQGLSETVREKFPNVYGYAGTVVIFCIGDTVEVKARGLHPDQVVSILQEIISKIV